MTTRMRSVLEAVARGEARALMRHGMLVGDVRRPRLTDAGAEATRAARVGGGS
jgi:hypothetical protein